MSARLLCNGRIIDSTYSNPTLALRVCSSPHPYSLPCCDDAI